MYLNFKVTLSDIFLNSLESLLLFLELLFLDLKSLMHFVHFATFLQQLGSWGNCFELDMRGDLLDLLSLFLHGVQFRLTKIYKENNFLKENLFFGLSYNLFAILWIW